MDVFQSRKIKTIDLSVQNKLLYCKVTCYPLLTLPFPHGPNQTAGFSWQSQTGKQLSLKFCCIPQGTNYFQVTKMLDPAGTVLMVPSVI